MSSIVEIINGIAIRWSDGMWLIVWQSAVLAVIIYLVTSCIRRASAATCFWLWMLVPLRLLVMPLVTISLPLLPVASPELSGTDVGSLSTEVIAVNPAEAIQSEQGLGLEKSKSILSPASIERTTEKHVLPSLWAFLMTGWLIGLMLCIIRLLREWRKVSHITTQAVEAAESGILESAREARTKLGLKHMPKILVTKERISPFLFGVLRPVLVVPEGLIANVRAEELVAVLSHEFAHVRRRDPLIGWLLAICETIYFFHPVFYLVKGRILFERERACDSWVLYSSKARSSVYANALISAADICRGFKTSVGPVGAVAESFADLKKRLVVISRNLKPKAQLSISALVFLLIVGAVCTPGIFLTARAEEQVEAKPKRRVATPLHQAAVDGDIEQVKALIKAGADVNATDGRDNTPLCRAVASGNMEVVQLLVEAGADVNAGNWPPLCEAVDIDNVPIARYLIDKGANINIPEGWTALQEAPYKSSLEMIKLLIAKGGDVNAGPYTALHGAVQNNRTDIIELLLENGADINTKAAKRNVTPLCLAACYYDLDTIKLLLARGADPGIADDGGFLPLHWAALRGDKDILDLLLSKGNYANSIYVAAYRGDVNRVKSFIEGGVSVNTKDEGGWTPLHWAGLADSPEVAEYLIAKGADVNARAGNSFTPLRNALSLPVIKLLISKGADINATDTDLGLTKLHKVCESGDIDIVELLIDNGADVNAKPTKGGMYGRTPLHFAAIFGHPDIAKLLISKGADINAVCPWRSDHRQTALHLAARTGHTEVVEYLLTTEGFDVNVQDSKGQTALDLAKKQMHIEVVELLKKNGAKESTQATQNQGSINETQKNLSSFEMAILSNDLEKVKELIAQGADVNTRDSRGNTPLLQAIMMGRLSFVEALISAGADIKAKNRRGMTPLDLAKRRSNTKIVEILTKASEEQTTVEKKPSTDESPADSKEPKPAGTLHEAARDGDIEQVKRLIAQGTNINVLDNRNCTPIYYAALRGHKDIVEIFLANGADVNERDRFGYTLLYPAVWSNDTDTMRFMIEKGIDVNLAAEEDYPPLYYAVMNNDLESVEVLLAKGARFDIKTFDGYTVFYHAALMGKGETVKFFVGKGADLAKFQLAACTGDLDSIRRLAEQGTDIDAKDKFGWTALHWAASMNQKVITEFLLSRNANINVRTNNNETPLLHSIRSGALVLSELLISKGANVKASGKDGRTPLHRAAVLGNNDLIKLLIDKGSEIDCQNNQGATPLYLACATGKRDTAALLISKGSDVNAKTANGWTALHRATSNGRRPIVSLLIDKGADVNAKNNGGQTPLHRAAAMGRLSVVEPLLKSGADVNVKDDRGKTPLELAEQFGQTEIVEILTKAAQEQTSAEKKPSDDEPPAESKELKPARILHEAAAAGDIERVKSLIADGAEISAKDEEGKTPLHYAAKRRNTEVTRLLIKANADLNCKDKDGETPMAIARINWRVDVVKLLVSKGADVDLESAAYLGDLAKVRSFIESDPNVTESKLNQLLMWSFNSGSLSQGHRDVAEYLFDKGANPNARDKNEATILHRWAWGGDLEITKSVMEIVIKRGADVNARQGELGGDTTRLAGTPLHSACSRGRTSVAKFLLDNGADVNAKNNNDQTPLDLAKRRRRTDLVELLRKYGAKE